MASVRWFDSISKEDVDIAGGKGASLGEMIQNTKKLGIDVPNGFVVTTNAYEKFIEHNNLKIPIEDELSSKEFDMCEFDDKKLAKLRRIGLKIRKMIENGEFPVDVENSIIESYRKLSSQYFDTDGNPQTYTDVAVRSSSTAEDLPDASFAGQQDTYLNVRENADLLTSVKKCFASLFNDRAISYRQSNNFSQFSVKIAVCVQKMVRSDLGISGVAFSLCTESGFRDVNIINATYGLGELLVGGVVNPDEYIVYKPFNTIISHKLGSKEKTMIYSSKSTNNVEVIPTTISQKTSFCLSDDRIKLLSSWTTSLENHYNHPVDVEWAIDGLSGDLFVVQCRPETVASKKIMDEVRQVSIDTTGYEKLTRGTAVGDAVGVGEPNIMLSLDQRYGQKPFVKGQVLVTDMTDPDWLDIMKQSSAIVTNRGGRCCHASIVARELGIPCIVGTEDATKVLENEKIVTVSCAEGETGFVYEGNIPFKETVTRLSELGRPKVSLMLNVGSPDVAFQYANYPCEGVGLAREEFIANNIGIHPLAILDPSVLEEDEVTQVQGMTRGYKDPIDFYVQKLSEGVARIAAPFYPNPVILRFSDFKSNEYYNLIGGRHFEPKEDNPMIGWRGASRYYDPRYKDAFALECRAVRRVIVELGFDNVIVMIPFCRTPEEAERVTQVMYENGLCPNYMRDTCRDGDPTVKVYLMCEIPSNVVMAKEFCQYVDGFSIGSNDLTQLTYGLDRDSERVAHLFNERHPAIKRMISLAIKTVKENGKKIGICGQGPSDYPEFAEFLMEEGIDTISVTPDSLLKTIKRLS